MKAKLLNFFEEEKNWNFYRIKNDNETEKVLYFSHKETEVQICVQLSVAKNRDTREKFQTDINLFEDGLKTAGRPILSSMFTFSDNIAEYFIVYSPKDTGYSVKTYYSLNGDTSSIWTISGCWKDEYDKIMSKGFNWLVDYITKDGLFVRLYGRAVIIDVDNDNPEGGEK